MSGDCDCGELLAGQTRDERSDGLIFGVPGLRPRPVLALAIIDIATVCLARIVRRPAKAVRGRR